jgi:hypothetical protein
MHATIAAHADFKKITGARIDAGTDELLFVSPHQCAPLCRPCTRPGGSPSTGQASAGRGWSAPSGPSSTRGPGSSSRASTRLDSASIQNTTAVLNGPGRVRLSDHARATVGPLTVQLAARIITDAEMTVGSDVLRSPTAPFSENDL